MKKILVLSIVFTLLIVFSAPVSAQGAAISPEDVPKDAAEYLPSDIFASSPEEIIESFSAGNILKTLFSVAKSVFSEAMEAFMGLLGLIIISSVIAALRDSVASSEMGAFLDFISVLCVSGASFSFVEELFEDFEAFVANTNAFMSAAVPTMSALLASGGEVTASAVFGTALSGAVTLLELVTASAVMPMLRALLCVNTVSKVCAEDELAAFSGLLKNTLTYTLTTLTAVMTCVLAFQSVIAKSADTAAVKGVKFVLGNAVPIIGGALADAVGTVASSMGIVKSITGIAGAAVLCVICALPVVKLIIWKTVFDAASAVAGAMSLKKESGFFSGMGSIAAFMAAITSGISVFFIIALTAFAAGG